MALSIKNERTDNIVRRYAKIHNTSCTQAIHIAVADAMRREGHAVDEGEERQVEDFLTLVHKLQVEVAAAPMLDERTPDEILYDDDGLPH